MASGRGRSVLRCAAEVEDDCTAELTGDEVDANNDGAMSNISDPGAMATVVLVWFKSIEDKLL